MPGAATSGAGDGEEAVAGLAFVARLRTDHPPELSVPNATRGTSLEVVVKTRRLRVAEVGVDVPNQVIDELVTSFHEDLIC